MNTHTHYRQRGAATLLIVTVLLLVTALITLFTARSAVNEQRLSANNYRYAQAFSAAEYGVEQALAYLNQHRPVLDSSVAPAGWVAQGLWQACSGTALPCGDGATTRFDNNWLFTGPIPNLVPFTDPSLASTVWAVTQNQGGAPAPFPLMYLVARGTADNGSAEVLIQRAVRGDGLFVNAVPSPLTVAGNTNLNGNYTVWGNPNGLGPGQVLSTWSQGIVTLGGSVETYDTNVVQFPRTRRAAVLSDSSLKNTDIVDNSPTFPNDLFYYVFGVPRSDANRLKQDAQVLPDCSSLSPASMGLIWVTGDCDITSANIGSANTPVVLIIDGQFRQNGNSAIFGLVFVMDTTTGVSLTGVINFQGALLVDKDVNLGSGTFDLAYNGAVLAALNTQAGRFAYVEGSWNDDF